MAAGDVPPYHELLLPTLQAVGELGGSASISEIVQTVIKRQGFSDAQQAVLHNDGPETSIGYRLAWPSISGLPATRSHKLFCGRDRASRGAMQSQA